MTCGGTDPLLSAEENCAHIIGPPNELEVSRAFTRKMNHLLCVMKVIHRFKAILARKRAAAVSSSGSSLSSTPKHSQQPLDAAGEGSRDEIEALMSRRRNFLGRNSNSGGSGDKGHAHDVSDQEPLFLGIGTGARDDFAMDEATPDIVSDSPTAVDFNVYDRAYENAIERIKLNPNSTRKPTMYLTKFVKEKEQFENMEDLKEGSGTPTPLSEAGGRGSDQEQHTSLSAKKLAQLAANLDMADTRGDKDAKQDEA